MIDAMLLLVRQHIIIAVCGKTKSLTSSPGSKREKKEEMGVPKMTQLQ
jgi:hypothetical protein